MSLIITVIYSVFYFIFRFLKMPILVPFLCLTDSKVHTCAMLVIQ